MGERGREGGIGERGREGWERERGRDGFPPVCTADCKGVITKFST